MTFVPPLSCSVYWFGWSEANPDPDCEISVCWTGKWAIREAWGQTRRPHSWVNLFPIFLFSPWKNQSFRESSNFEALWLSHAHCLGGSVKFTFLGFCPNQEETCWGLWSPWLSCWLGGRRRKIQRSWWNTKSTFLQRLVSVFFWLLRGFQEWICGEWSWLGVLSRSSMWPHMFRVRFIRSVCRVTDERAWRFWGAQWGCCGDGKWLERGRQGRIFIRLRRFESYPYWNN